LYSFCSFHAARCRPAKALCVIFQLCKFPVQVFSSKQWLIYKKIRKRNFTSTDIEGISGKARPEQVLLRGKDYIWTESAIYPCLCNTGVYAVKMLLRFKFQPT
jgi:hypothetical protein